MDTTSDCSPRESPPPPARSSVHEWSRGSYGSHRRLALTSGQFEQESVRALGSLDVAERRQGWEALYAQDLVFAPGKSGGRRSSTREPRAEWVGFAAQVARKLVRRLAVRDLEGCLQPVMDPEDAAQQGWERLRRRVEREPLDKDFVRIGGEEGFGGYLYKCVSSEVLDRRRKVVGGPGIVKRLQRVQARLTSVKDKLWVQQMIDLERAGSFWNDSEDLARRLGAERGLVDTFIERTVRPLLVDRRLRGRAGPVAASPDRSLAKDLLDGLSERGEKLFDRKTKAYWVFRALLALGEEGLHDAGSVNHFRMMEELDRLGNPWTSDDRSAKARRHLAHRPGLPDAWACESCRVALHTRVSWALKRMSNDTKCRELWRAYCQERRKRDVEYGQAAKAHEGELRRERSEKGSGTDET